MEHSIVMFITCLGNESFCEEYSPASQQYRAYVEENAHDQQCQFEIC
jgi:hypothetical protein